MSKMYTFCQKRILVLVKINRYHGRVDANIKESVGRLVARTFYFIGNNFLIEERREELRRC